MSPSQGYGHGKVILLGEHSVVYGRPAIAAGMSLGCSAEAEPSQVDALTVTPWGVRVEAERSETDNDLDTLQRAFTMLCQRCGSERPKLHVRAHMQIPGGAGLGGSAALSVAVLRAMNAQLARNPSTDDMLEASLAWERVYHGNPSGIDSAMAIRGGLALFRRGEALQSIRLARALSLVVANSGERGDTISTVASVARQYRLNTVKVEQILDSISALVSNAKTALEIGDYKALGQLMDMNQKLLNCLLLSTNTLEEMCNAARAAGALGAKLTGGGGGGCMLALAADGPGAVQISQALADSGYQTFVVEVTP